MMRQIQSKKIQNLQQNNNSQRLFLARCFIEQQQEMTCNKKWTRRRAHITIKSYDDGSVVFKVSKTKKIAAIAKDSKLYIFAKPLENFKGGFPNDTKVVSLNHIVKTDGVMRCNKCKSWVQNVNIAKCSCGGRLQQKKRFHLKDEITESLDDEYLEIQYALEDVKISDRMDSRPRHKTPISMGVITASMAGISSSVERTPTTTHTGMGFLTAVSVKSANGKKILNEDEKYSFFEKMGADIQSIQNDEIQEYEKMDEQRRARIAIDSWNNNKNNNYNDIPRNVEYAIQNSKRHSRGRQQKRTSPNTRKVHHSARNELVSKKRKSVTCSICDSNTPALVEGKCPDCFLKVAKVAVKN